jgi:hypothetical protein
MSEEPPTKARHGGTIANEIARHFTEIAYQTDFAVFQELRFDVL